MQRAWTLACAVALAWLALPLVAAPGAAQANAQVRVAVVDSGIDASHDDFQGQPIERHSFRQPTVPQPPLPGIPVDPLGDLQPDPDGQGTGVASRVAGKGYGALKDLPPLHEMAQRIMLVDLQVAGNYTRGQLDPRTEDAAASAMDWLQANAGGNGSAGPRIALLSFASRDLSGPGAQNIVAAAERLWDLGVLVIVPAGSSALHRSPYVLAVGMEANECSTSFGSSAPIKPDVGGDGADVTVARPRQSPAEPTAGAGSWKRTGTAYAAAHVASLAAVLWVERPDLPVDVLAAILRDTARDAGDPGPDSCTGRGHIEPMAALSAARAWKDPTPSTALSKPSPAPLLAAVGALALVAARRRKAGR